MKRSSFWDGVGASFLLALATFCALIAFGDLKCKRLPFQTEILVCGVDTTKFGIKP